MNSVLLFTPSYTPDFERCRLLCESIDRFVTGHVRHVIAVNSEEMQLFETLAGPKRHIVNTNVFLPQWLRPLPFGLKIKGRKFWWSLRTPPVRGWHLQQLVKFGGAAAGPEDVSVILDSDTVFVRPVDIAAVVGMTPTPHIRLPDGITADLAAHPKWLASTHRLLHLPQPKLPATDYIANVIPWRRDTVRSLLARIEANTKTDWQTAILRERAFSEYLLYGYHVASTPDEAARHAPQSHSFAQEYWGDDALDAAGLGRQLKQLGDQCFAISVHSHSGTSLDLVRSLVGIPHAR